MTTSGTPWSGISTGQNFGWSSGTANALPQPGNAGVAGGFQDAAVQFGVWMQGQLHQAYLAGFQAGMQAGQQNLGQQGSGFGPGAAWNQGAWNGWGQTQPNMFGQNGFGQNGFGQNGFGQNGFGQNGFGGGVGSPLHTLFGGGIGEGASRDAA